MVSVDVFARERAGVGEGGKYSEEISKPNEGGQDV